MATANQVEMRAGLRGRSSGRHSQTANISGGTPRSRNPASSTQGQSEKSPSRGMARHLAIPVIALAIWAAHHELRTYRLDDIVESLRSLPLDAIVAAIALTTLGHLVHVGYDLLALRYAEHPLPWRKVAFGSLITYSLSAVTGFTGVIGASLRYRFWSAWGVSKGEIVKGVSFAALTAGLGATTAAGAVLTAAPAALSLATGLPAGALRGIGAALVVTTVGYLGACATVRRTLNFGRVSLQLPPPGLGLIQVVIAVLDWSIAGWVFFVLLPSNSTLGFFEFLSIFLLTQVGGLVAHVPAGIGVFDATILWLLRPFTPGSEAAAALIAYRAVAYLLPFLLAGLALGGYEASQRRTALLRVMGQTKRCWSAAVPLLLSVTTFLAGCILLASDATPGIPSRLAWLANIVPLQVIEAAHFIASITGVGLLILARGLYRRLDAAYHLTILALAVGVGASLLKGADYEEALLLTVVLGLALPARGRFYRRAALLSGPWSAGWLIAVGLAVGATVWLGLFSYRHLAYTNDLWWQFTLNGNAPRFLRAAVGIAVFGAAAALWHLLSPSQVLTVAPSEQELERAAKLAYESGELTLYLALLRDKALLFGSGGGALMYSVSGRSWIAMGDPIGSPEDRAELAWGLKEMADRHGGRAVFYEVGPHNLPLYVELGLTLVKVGETGRVPLAAWSLEDPASRKLRRTMRKIERAGCSFDVLPAGQVPPLLPELKAISDAWLCSKRTREKGFSLGLFDEQYLGHFPIAVVRSERGIVAFANLWLSAHHQELSLDLMRYHPEAPPGVMEYVVANLLLWGKAQNYAWFNLGMAPLAGLDSRALAPLWSRLGAIAFRHGEHFYNFRGLRHYKEQFGPVWEPRFLAVPSRLVLPQVLSNLATLISGGLTGVITK
jgi:phosphatidylglycerol lysyltransferase